LIAAAFWLDASGNPRVIPQMISREESLDSSGLVSSQVGPVATSVWYRVAPRGHAA